MDKRRQIYSFGVGQEPLTPQHEIRMYYKLLLMASGWTDYLDLLKQQKMDMSYLSDCQLTNSLPLVIYLTVLKMHPCEVSLK
jgi:hypothetical protein